MPGAFFGMIGKKRVIKMHITKVEVIEINQKFANKDQTRKYFGFAKKSTATFQRYLAEFKQHSDFGSGYINPTGGYVLIDIDKFEQFLRWKDKNKYV